MRTHRWFLRDARRVDRAPLEGAWGQDRPDDAQVLRLLAARNLARTIVLLHLRVQVWSGWVGVCTNTDNCGVTYGQVWLGWSSRGQKRRAGRCGK